MENVSKVTEKYHRVFAVTKELFHRGRKNKFDNKISCMIDNLGIKHTHTQTNSGFTQVIEFCFLGGWQKPVSQLK